MIPCATVHVTLGNVNSGIGLLRARIKGCCCSIKERENVMRVAFIISFMANALLALLSLALLPARVAIHFDPGGTADGWAPGYVNSLIFLGLDTGLFLSLYFSPRLILAFPAEWVNLPNKHFWLAPENLLRTGEKISALMYRFGTAMFLFLFATGLLTVQANLAEPVKLNERLLLMFLGLFLAYTVVWVVFFYRSFRVPNEKDVENQVTKGKRI